MFRACNKQANRQELPYNADLCSQSKRIVDCWLVRVVVVMGAASGQILANLTADNAATQGVRTLEWRVLVKSICQVRTKYLYRKCIDFTSKMQTLVQMENLLYTLKAYNVVQYQRSLLARRGIETTWQNHPSVSLFIFIWDSGLGCFRSACFSLNWSI